MWRWREWTPIDRMFVVYGGVVTVDCLIGTFASISRPLWGTPVLAWVLGVITGVFMLWISIKDANNYLREPSQKEE